MAVPNKDSSEHMKGPRTPNGVRGPIELNYPIV